MASVPCPRCGAPPEPGARFCGTCGERLPDPSARVGPLKGAPRDRPREVPRTLVQPPAEPPRPPSHPVGRPPSHPAAAPVSAPAQPALASLPTRPPSLERIVGRVLNNRYTIVRKIGEGGFGAVFEGKQVATGREVALKLLHPHNVSDSTVVARFRREAEACSRLRSPHIVTIYDFDETPDGILFLVMELVRGRSLQHLQRADGPLPARRVLNVLHQVAEALAEAHDQGIVHRDMKPENVMVETRGGEDLVKVLDFGIAKIVSGEAAKNAPALTAVGQTVGTLEFMSPEQLRGKQLDGRSDIYALGMIAYEILTGDLPFKGAKAPTDIIQFHLNKEPPPPSRLRPNLKIPAAVDGLVLKMVAKSRDDRHANAHELKAHVEEAIAALDASARRRGFARVGAIIGAAAIAAAVLLGLLLR